MPMKSMMFDVGYQEGMDVFEHICDVESKAARRVVPQKACNNAVKEPPVHRRPQSSNADCGGGNTSALDARIDALFKPKPKCPWANYVRLVDIHAKTGPQVVRAKMIYHICVLKGDAQVKLLPGSIGVADVEVSATHPEKSEAKPSDAAPDGGRVAFVDGSTNFYTTSEGEYVVTLTAEVPYVSELKQAVTFDVPLASRVKLSAVVEAQRVDVSVPQAVEVESKEDGAVTLVDAVIPPTETVTMKWVKKPEDRRVRRGGRPEAGPAVTRGHADSASTSVTRGPPEKLQPKKEMLITSGQDYHLAVGGGMCFFTLDQHYTITNGSASTFVLEVDGEHGSGANNLGYDALLAAAAKTRVARILDVEGANLRGWEVTEDPDRPRVQLLKLMMSKAVDGRVSFVIKGEMDMLSTSCSAVCPTLRPLNTNRVKGNVAVQAKTAVEISEIKAARLQKIDPSELPGKLKSLTNVLHAYKFLAADFSLALEVTKHDDVAVLVATAETAVYTITHTKEHLFYHLAFNIRNTQRQFARVRVPDAATIWSALLDGEAVKPAMDAQGHVLIPLRKDTTDLFSAELIYVMPAAIPEVLKVQLPTIDVPIHHLYVQLWMPDRFRYSQWGGDGMEEIGEYTVFPTIGGGGCGGGGGGARLRRVGSGSWSADLAGVPAPHGNTGDAGAGIRPLTFKTTPLRTGRAFKLERVLVPTREAMTLECSTCVGDRKKLRTLAGQEPSCVVM